MQKENINKKQITTDLAAQIKGFDFDKSLVEIHFLPDVYNLEQIKTMLNNIGINQIIYSNIDTKGKIIEGYSFMLKSTDLNQKAIIDNLNYNFIRIKALKDLYRHGGLQLTKEESNTLKQYGSR